MNSLSNFAPPPSSQLQRIRAPSANKSVVKPVRRSVCLVAATVPVAAYAAAGIGRMTAHSRFYGPMYNKVLDVFTSISIKDASLSFA